MFRKAKHVISEVLKKPESRWGLSILIGLLLVFVVGLACLIISLVHPGRHYGMLTLFSITIFPAVIAFISRKGRLRGALIFEPVDPADIRNVGKVFLRSPFVFFWFPLVAIAISWGFLHYMLTTKPDSTTPLEWGNSRTHVLIPITLLPSVLAGSYFVTHHLVLLAVYMALGCAYMSLTIAVGGLRMEKGVIGFFDKWKAQSSPLVTLSCAVVFSISVALLHYAISIRWPEEYSGLHGLQDAIYFSIITMATVGYGDVIPIGHLARWLTVFQVAASFVMLVVAVSASMSIWIQKHQPDDAKLVVTPDTSEDKRTES